LIKKNINYKTSELQHFKPIPLVRIEVETGEGRGGDHHPRARVHSVRDVTRLGYLFAVFRPGGVPFGHDRSLKSTPLAAIMEKLGLLTSDKDMMSVRCERS